MVPNDDDELQYLQTTLQYYKDDATGSEILYVCRAAILKVIKSYIKLHITITEKGIIKYKLKIRL